MNYLEPQEEHNTHNPDSMFTKALWRVVALITALLPPHHHLHHLHGHRHGYRARQETWANLVTSYQPGYQPASVQKAIRSEVETTSARAPSSLKSGHLPVRRDPLGGPVSEYKCASGRHAVSPERMIVPAEGSPHLP